MNDKKKTYNFKAANWIIFLLASFSSLIGGMILILPISSRIFPDFNIFNFILTFGVLVFFVILIVRLTSLAKVEITLDDETISIKWREQFLFHKKRDVIIPFNEIATYVNQSDMNWDWLKIVMNDGKIYRIWHSGWVFKNGDYFNFVSAFVSAVGNHNDAILKEVTKANLEVSPKLVKRAPSFYEGKSGAIMKGFAIVFMVLIPILLILVLIF